MEQNTIVNLPKWMKLDTRPIDRGRFGKWGYGYTRPVGKRELWRPAFRYIVRGVGKFSGFREVKLKSGAYYVSDHGRLYSANRGIIISSSRKHRRKRTMLQTESGKYIHVFPYRVALDNFIEPYENYKSVVRRLFGVVNHVDGAAWNNKLSNIVYSTNSENVKHARNVLHRGGRRKLNQEGKKHRRKQSNEKSIHT